MPPPSPPPPSPPPLPPPPPVYDFHFWKCYFKEGAHFQTAKLFSVEVDYYHFGTCRLVDGAYFCGDHSCNTYKHIGQKNKKRSSTVVDRVVDTDDPFDSAVSSYPQNDAADSRFQKYIGFEDGHMQLRGPDQMAATYGEYPGFLLNLATANTLHSLSDMAMDSDASTTADCKVSCDGDSTCVAYATRHSALQQSGACRIYTRSTLPIRVGLSLDAAMVADGDFTSYVKITNPKRQSWMHGDSQPQGYFGDALQNSGTTRGDGAPARRLEGLY